MMKTMLGFAEAVIVRMRIRRKRILLWIGESEFFLGVLFVKDVESRCDFLFGSRHEPVAIFQGGLGPEFHNGYRSNVCAGSS